MSLCVVMDKISCADAMQEYRAIIIGECDAEMCYAAASDLCEVQDLVQEAHIHLLSCWPRLTARARNLQCCIRTETRWFVRRYLKQQRRRTFPPIDLTTLDAA